MKTYVLTVFDQEGKKLLEETFEAASDKDAEKIGTNRLEDLEYSNYTHRCVSPDGKLVLFHR
ncbi:YhzD family protein [Sediminibacillus halophilus]|uniref:YhzD-like protein n=1 Tax=Sediminibacillus halophilus TaxID=482461 RepID=A0A1G9PQJ2_9BACI|nr:YhzD family protein [Sediminibacillus halophilus]SDM01004.1 YhzD-like protein [Sediminibacillus halophilus]